ncbi:DNA internalization-related competence protein ComEC/Rec2 [Vagococcus carniphilus]|uniref:DNA internalization-related competence protein ComEC/Rec2 n=1 Tax=Vagococcus carniphilus TaxID=218144 RepID=UPI003BA85F75
MTCCLLVSSLFFFHLFESKEKNTVLENTELKVYPDTVKLDGDLLSFKAKDFSTSQTMIVKYRLQDEKEKEFFLSNRRTLVIQGEFEEQEVEGVRNLNGFDYAHYLEITNISKQIKLIHIQSMKQEKILWYQLNWKLKELRRACIVHNQKQFGLLTQNYMNSLLFGFQDNTPENYQQTWKKLGVAHLFSLSGMHIYFFLTLFDYILLRLSICRDKVFKLNLLFTFILVSLTGMGPGMVRAGLQHVIKRLNQRFEWILSPLDCWSLALFINCLFSPYVLLTVGGQLTYYLTFLIIVILPIIEKIENVFYQGIFFNMLLSTLSLPLIWYYFYEWNLLSFIVNLILGPVLFIVIMPLLLLSFLTSFVLINNHFIWLEKILILFQSIGNKTNELTLFKQVVGKLPFWLLIMLILSQIFILIEWEKRNSWLNRKIIVLGSLTLLVPFSKYLNPFGTLAIVDIGQGDSIFLQLPFHQGNYLLDTGGVLGFEVEEWQKRSDKRSADYTVIPYLKSMGVKELDTVFISHAHEDHFGDLDRIGESIDVKSICYGPGSYEQSNFRKCLALSQFKRTRKKAITNQDRWQKHGINLNCLYPTETGDGQNNDSLVMMLTIKEKRILLTGDLEKEGENDLMNQEDINLKADILKAGHHGSNTSSQPDFLEKISPKIAIISCGKNNRYNHPSKETLDNFGEISTKVYRTDLNGMIYFKWSLFSNYFSEPFVMK